MVLPYAKCASIDYGLLVGRLSFFRCSHCQQKYGSLCRLQIILGNALRSTCANFCGIFLRPERVPASLVRMIDAMCPNPYGNFQLLTYLII